MVKSHLKRSEPCRRDRRDRSRHGRPASAGARDGAQRRVGTDPQYFSDDSMNGAPGGIREQPSAAKASRRVASLATPDPQVRERALLAMRFASEAGSRRRIPTRGRSMTYALATGVERHRRRLPALSGSRSGGTWAHPPLPCPITSRTISNRPAHAVRLNSSGSGRTIGIARPHSKRTRSRD